MSFPEPQLFSPSSTETVDWIAGLPKVELHVHLEGSLSPTTMSLLAARHGVSTAEIWPGGLPERFSFDGFPDFARQFQFGLKLIKTGDDLETIVVAMAQQLAQNNVRYAEVTSTVYTHITSGLAAADYGQALSSGRKRAEAEHGVLLNWVIDIPRDLEMPGSTITSDFLASKHAPDGLISIGLGGYEVGFPPEPYADDFARARALGLHSVPHAGETEGADSIIGALDELGAERIGHGVRCLEDESLVHRLVDSGTTLEVCLTSNVLLSVTSSIEAHPLRTLIEKGLRVTLSTDDPGTFATDMNTELLLAHNHHGVSLEQLRDLQLTALNASFLDPTNRAMIANQIRSYPALG
jgi:aminodeoxyfutalosine deaminase